MKPVIDQQTRANLNLLIDYALLNPVTLEKMRENINSQVHAGDDDHLKLEIPGCFNVVFSIEQHPAGWCRHVSVLVDIPGYLPSEESVDLILENLGFNHPVDRQGVLFVEKGKVINIIEHDPQLEILIRKAKRNLL